jgi:phosphoglucosamine mutase
MGIEFVRAKVGDRYILEQLQRRDWLLGGEGSGHLLCLDRHTTGDGIVSALQILSGLKRSGQSLAEFTAEIDLYPQALVNVRIPAGFDWENNTAMQAAKTAVEQQLGDNGRVLIRPSGTEPLLRVMVEAPKGADAQGMAQRIADQVLAA